MIAVNPDLLWTCPPRRPRSPWPLTLLILAGLLCWCVGERVSRGDGGVARPDKGWAGTEHYFGDGCVPGEGLERERKSPGEPGPNTGADSASHSTQGGARPAPRSEVIDEPRAHRVLQPPPLGQDPARTLPGSLRALATWMGAIGLLGLIGLIWAVCSSAWRRE